VTAGHCVRSPGFEAHDTVASCDVAVEAEELDA
jgi:hypothetical protein